MIKCPECKREYTIEDLTDSTYLMDVFDGDPARASVSISLHCPNFDCHADIYDGDGQITLHYYGE